MKNIESFFRKSYSPYYRKENKLMKKFKSKKAIVRQEQLDAINREIDNDLEALKLVHPDTEDAKAIALHLDMLVKTRAQLVPRRRPSSDAILAAATSIGTVILIMVQEEKSIFPRSVSGFITKLPFRSKDE